MSRPVAAVIGVGPGTGRALARRFARGGHRIALLSRSADALDAMAAEIGDAKAFACDASDPDRVREAIIEVETSLGPVTHLLFNAGSGVFGGIDEVDDAALEQAWRINALGLFAAAQAVAPRMRAAGRGSIVVTGATASLRGGASFLAFAQAKAAQRSIAQSLARKLGPEGIHVALIIVDGMIDLERTRARMPDAPDEKFLRPDAIADAAWYLAEQDPSAWTFELDLRPHVERW